MEIDSSNVTRVRRRVIKRKRKFAKIITRVLIIGGIFLLVWDYVSENYDIADFSESNGKYGEVFDQSIFYAENNYMLAAVGLGMIFIGLLIRYRKRILPKSKHKSERLHEIHLNKLITHR